MKYVILFMVKNPVNNEINYQPQLVPGISSINSIIHIDLQRVPLELRRNIWPILASQAHETSRPCAVSITCVKSQDF